MIPEEVVEAVDAAVPAGATHVGFVPTNIPGQVLVTEPPDHPYNVSATFSKVRLLQGERPSHALSRCLRDQVGQSTKSVFPIPAVWTTSNSAGYYFAGMLWNEGAPTCDTIRGLRWVSLDEAEGKIKHSQNVESRNRDLGLLRSVADMSLSPYRRILLMVGELHRMGFQGLRAPAYEYPLAWRCPVVPASWTFKEHGGMCEVHHPALESLLHQASHKHIYSSASGQRPFEWTHCEFASPGDLARRFIADRSEVAFAGWGPDEEYVAWLANALERTRPNGIYLAFGEFLEPTDSLYTLMAPVRALPLPPPGVASRAAFEAFSRRFNSI